MEGLQQCRIAVCEDLFDGQHWSIVNSSWGGINVDLKKTWYKWLASCGANFGEGKGQIQQSDADFPLLLWSRMFSVKISEVSELRGLEDFYIQRKCSGLEIVTLWAESFGLRYEEGRYVCRKRSKPQKRVFGR